MALEGVKRHASADPWERRGAAVRRTWRVVQRKAVIRSRAEQRAEQAGEEREVLLAADGLVRAGR